MVEKIYFKNTLQTTNRNWEIFKERFWKISISRQNNSLTGHYNTLKESEILRSKKTTKIEDVLARALKAAHQAIEIHLLQEQMQQYCLVLNPTEFIRSSGYIDQIIEMKQILDKEVTREKTPRVCWMTHEGMLSTYSNKQPPGI